MLRSRLAAATLLALVACSEETRDKGEIPYEFLSDYDFFDGDLRDQEPADDVIPYTVVAPLWADAAGKGRFLWLPEGGKINYSDQDPWQFPLGSIFIKTFFFDRDRRPGEEDLKIVETRLLILTDEGWESEIYVYDEDETEAVRHVAGKDVFIDYVDEDGADQTQPYIVPDKNTCETCHQLDDVEVLLGPITSQLNIESKIRGETVNQIDYLRDEGLFDGPVPPATDLPAFAAPDGSGDLDARSRSYLHANCAHCHRPGGGGGASGLSFLFWQEDPAQYGVCKLPSAAGGGTGGNSYDIVPGSPEESIVIFRMASEDPELKMPELPSLLADDFGVELISEWITQLPDPACETE